MAHIRTNVATGVEAQGRKPPGWGDDQLAAFLDVASDNVLGTYAQMRPEYATMQTVDAAYVTFMDALLNPQDPIAPLFVLQAHAAFRAAAGLAMSGQSSPAFMVMRGCLESSLYGLYFNRHFETFEVWAHRHDDEEARRRVKNEFTIRRLRDCLGAIDPETNDVVGQLYEKTIDFGAHPNVLALAGAFRASRAEGRQQFKVIYLTADPLTIRGTMKSVAQSGVCSLLIFRNVFAERFDLLGITDTLRELRARL